MKAIIWNCLFLLTSICYQISCIDQYCLEKKRDILAVIDSSDLISREDFENSKTALTYFLSYFLISPNETRVALVGYGSTVKVDFDFVKHPNSAVMNFAIRLHKRIGGDSVAGKALEVSLQELVPKMRNDVERILILIGDGKNTAPPPIKDVASKIKAKNVDIYTIGIGSVVETLQLQAISTIYDVTTFADLLALQTSIKKLAYIICKVPIVTNSYPQGTSTITMPGKFVTTLKTEPPVKPNTTVSEPRTFDFVTPLKTEPPVKPNTTVFQPRPVETTTSRIVIPTTTMTAKIRTTRTEIPIPKTPPTDDCNSRRIDLMFALDASSSLARYWTKELAFATNVISSLTIGKQDSLVGIVTYSDQLEKVDFGEHTNKTTLLNVVKNLDLLEGSTFIANALRMCKEELVRKGREGVKKTIILVTDGADNSPVLKPDVEAETIKEMGMRMIVVGLGYSVVKEQLNKMSSSETYYPIEDMSKLDLFDTSMIAQDACHIEKPLPICNSKLDIALIIDSSSQVSQQEWNKQVSFAIDFINQFELGENRTRFSIISFAADASVVVPFTANQTDLLRKLQALQYIGGFTRIDKALNLASTTLYLKSFDTQKLVILLSNGLSMERVQSIGAAYDLQESGTKIMTISMGEKSDREELKILSSPYLSFMRRDVKEGKVLLENAINSACQISQIPKVSVCPSNGDIVFVVDKSSENSVEIWEGIKSLMLTTLQSFNISRSTTRISIISYSDQVKTEFRLDENFSRRDIFVAVKQLRIDGNGAELNVALTRARQIFKIDNRVEAAKILVLLTDKLPTNQKETLAEAESMKVDGVSIIYVGLSKNSPYTFYDELASKKSSIKIENINLIEKNKEQIKNLICDVFRHRQDECSMKKLDVIAAIDKSSSLGPDNFQIELDFINRVVGNLDLRKDRTRIGVFTFQTVVDLNLPIDSNLDGPDIQKEINKIPFDEGGTAIGMVIGNATAHLIEKGRTDVPKVIVVLTDGSNTVGIPPQIPAVEAKKMGIKIIAVGVGDEISEKELKDISTSGEFYSVKTFKDLEKYNAKVISNDACQIPQKPTVCQAAGDLIFIMGSSANKGTERFNQMAAFMKSLTQLTVVDKNFTRVAILKFNRGNYIDSGFKDNYKNFEDSIEDMTSSTNGVYIGKALRSSRVLFESDTRQNATKTVIIISDSQITDRNVTFSEANLLKKAGIKVFTIGLTGKVSDSDMKLVASPDKALFVENFNNLQRYNAYIASELCEVIRGTNKECNSKQLDIMIALDSSSSIGPEHWETELEFVEKILKDMDIGDTLTRVGIVTFNTYARKEFGLDKYSDKYSMLAAVKKLEFDDGATAIGDALRECKWELGNSTRRDIPRLILLVTDGASTGGISPEIESTTIKKQGIKIMVVGIGDSVSPAQLKTLSTTGKYYRILDFKSLKEYDTTYITRESCKAGKNQ